MSALPSRQTSYACESVLDLRDEVEPLLQAHWEELAFYRDIPLVVNWSKYVHADAVGGLRCYTVRDRGLLIGYAAFFLANNLHYDSTLYASQDVIFVSPEYRRGRVGLGLVRFCEEALRAEGVAVLLQHAKADPKHSYAALLERMGYERMDVIYAKRLDS